MNTLKILVLLLRSPAIDLVFSDTENRNLFSLIEKLGVTSLDLLLLVFYYTTNINYLRELKLWTVPQFLSFLFSAQVFLFENWLGKCKKETK